jgi:hypothetical protein
MIGGFSQQRLEFGPLAQPQLSEVLQQTTDAEVRRSVRAILKEMGK